MNQTEKKLEAKGVVHLESELNTLRLLPLEADEKRTRLDGYKGGASMLLQLGLIDEDQYGYFVGRIEKMRK